MWSNLCNYIRWAEVWLWMHMINDSQHIQAHQVTLAAGEKNTAFKTENNASGKGQ